MKNRNCALITGSAKRIGREIALMLAQNGYDIAINYNKSKTEAQKLASEISKKFKVEAEIFKCDLNISHEAKKLVNQVSKRFPNLNLLINNSSIFNKSKLSDFEKEFENNFNIHLKSPLILSLEFAKHIEKNKIKNANIINMIDKNITRIDTRYFYYLLSKKSLANATEMLSLQLAPSIRVNGIAPGFILNSIDEKNPSQETKDLISKIPLKKQGDVKNILQTIEFLLQNSFITGQIIYVDGGASLNHAG